LFVFVCNTTKVSETIKYGNLISNHITEFQQVYWIQADWTGGGTQAASLSVQLETEENKGPRQAIIIIA
jgi:hypothetical protein